MLIQKWQVLVSLLNEDVQTILLENICKNGIFLLKVSTFDIALYLVFAFANTK